MAPLRRRRQSEIWSACDSSPLSSWRMPLCAAVGSRTAGREGHSAGRRHTAQRRIGQRGTPEGERIPTPQYSFPLVPKRPLTSGNERAGGRTSRRLLRGLPSRGVPPPDAPNGKPALGLIWTPVVSFGIMCTYVSHSMLAALSLPEEPADGRTCRFTSREVPQRTPLGCPLP